MTTQIKFVQITVGGEELFAVDSAGFVWQYNSAYQHWEKLPSKRKEK